MKIEPALWKCDVCGYIHRGAIAPLQCPICGVAQEMFSHLKSVEIAASPARQAPKKWRCTVCNYEHLGDEPPDVCPRCGAKKEAFVLVQPKNIDAGPSKNSSSSSKKIVIVGAGIAGHTAAEEARRGAPSAAITLINSESDFPYYRLNLTRYLAGEISEQELGLQNKDWYRQNQIELVAGQAKEIDRANCRVQLSDQSSLAYDRLILACGAHAFIPPMAGATKRQVFVARTLADCRAILTAAQPGSRCVCLGGGLLGLETAGALNRRGLDVTLVESYPWLLPRQLAEPAARLLKEHLMNLGLKIILNDRAAELLGDEVVRGVRLETGEEIEADSIVIAAGIRPNSHLARRAGLIVKNGVVVDDFLRTSDENIFAAGDVAEHRGQIQGIWPTAFAQGLAAGHNAALSTFENTNGLARYSAIPMQNVLKVLSLDLFSIGVFSASDGSYRIYQQREGDNFSRLVIHDNLLVGANLLGDTHLAPAIKKVIEENIQRDEWPKELSALVSEGKST